jgi:N-acetylmuramoyl-L-alanine amidase
MSTIGSANGSTNAPFPPTRPAVAVRSRHAVLFAAFIVLVWLPIPASSPATPPARQDTSAQLVAPTAVHPVTPQVREVAVPSVGRRNASIPQTPAPALRDGPDLAALSRPVRSTGVGVVGATWRGAAPVGLRLAVRTRTGPTWSSWAPLRVEAGAHAPDPGTAEARSARPGSEPLVVGDVDRVQMRATSRSGRAPRALTLSVVDPGTSPADAAPVTVTAGSAGLTTPSATARLGVAPRPTIRSRAAWGADERLRRRAPTFGVVRAGFVHHTVNANAYSRAQVPAIIRAIYAFHVLSRGWSDIGYNFLVDRFGRIWEGRFGGVARNVIGAHTLGFNHLSFAMSAIGNFQTARPSPEMLQAYGELMAWKLGINGIAAGDANQRLRGRTLHAINGHRDVGQTACPGIRLYNRLPVIRRIAVDVQQGGALP